MYSSYSEEGGDPLTLHTALPESISASLLLKRIEKSTSMMEPKGEIGIARLISCCLLHSKNRKSVERRSESMLQERADTDGSERKGKHLHTG